MRIHLARMSRGKHLFVGAAGIAVGLPSLIGSIEFLMWTRAPIHIDTMEIHAGMQSQMPILMIACIAISIIFLAVGVLNLRIYFKKQSS